MTTSSTILIIDDDLNTCQTIEAQLFTEGHHLVFATTGLDGLVQAVTLQPDLILLDVMMPGMDGFEVCRCLRNDSALSDVPIVLLTALDDQDSRLQGLEAGADDFICKPFHRAELRARVRSIVRLNRYRKLHTFRRCLEQAHHELQLAYDETIEGWSRALDLRDKETEGHSQRVTEMTLRMARAVGMSEEDIVHVRRGALLHDMGKLGIPDSILLKPSKLTEEEWEIMHRHPTYAYELLYPIEYLRPALDIPYCHHEKWDGTGYPQGLRGTEIPLAARLFAVADVWDALKSDRPYRSGWPEDKVLEHIRSLSGSHFDPQIVEIFLGLLSN